MATATYKSMLDSRVEWKAHGINRTPLEFSDESLPQTIERILSLGLVLEMPVGAFVGEATKRDLPISQDAKNLLLSNIKDETIHYRAFQECAKVYPVSQQTMSEAENICKAWESLESHPLHVAGLLENGVFLASLAVLNLCGGHSLGRVAANVSRDEQRHVATNRSILGEIGIDMYQHQSKIERLRRQTIDWCFDGFSVGDLGIDKDWILEQSTLLSRDGESREMTELTMGSLYYPDFETEARLLY